MPEVTRQEAAEFLGYTHRSLTTLMLRHPDRWPAPTGRVKRGRTWHLVYDLDALYQAAGRSPDATGLRGAASLSDADGLITCLECGRRMRSLGVHLPRIHGITAAEYRALHHLPTTGATVSDLTRAQLQQTHRDMLAEDPDRLEHLAPYRTREHLTELARRAADPVRASHAVPLAQEHRRPGREYAVSRMVEARLQKLEDAARDHGYADVDDAITRTLHLPARAAARATGLSPQTITRRRGERTPDTTKPPPSRA